MKKILALIMCLIFGVGLVGCNTGSTTSQTSQNNSNELTGWEYIKSKGTLVVGLDDTFAPMGFRDSEGNLVGFDIDLAKAVGEVLGINIQFQPIDWNAKEMELSSKRIDCIWNGMSATPERQQKLSLTKKYLNNRIVIMSFKDSVNIKSVDMLADVKIGTQADSAALETMQNHAAYDSFKDNITEYNTYDEAIMDMQAGRIDCIVVDEVLGEYKNTKLEQKMHLSDFNFGDDYYAIGCRKGETDLVEKLNDAIKTLIDNGKAADISNKWFGRNIVILEDYDN
ncbi:MAG TPA: amino acid ABC transporter substrate-binding protein [Clostridiales bacterium]|nr:amino acid ABC transporter substrate-binding protein [Clostridiales bacterium]